ncbi:uncharacterized protein LOC117343646 [Pecten maximus]|uniref:uncharacterized protein LOC117343646 n=1 Tax=Pecten maximus TaxID=6579 RepID=UPI001458BB21|nr:uncharacterized protein LOC117343646 [Pecten maximus]
MAAPMCLPAETKHNKNNNAYIGSNNTMDQTNCKVCLGLGEFRSAAVCLPSGFMIDRLGNGCSAIAFSTLVLLGSILFAVGALSHPPVTTPMYILMVTGYGFLAFGDTSLCFVQARVVSHCFPEATLIALAFGFFGYMGQGVSLYTTPVINTAVGLRPAVWIGPVSCGFGCFCAVGLAFLLHLQSSVKVVEDNENKKVLGCVLNSRIRRWQQSDIERIELISKADPSSKYCGNSDDF